MAKWHDIDWTLTISIPGSEIDLKPNVANKFQFEERPQGGGGPIMLYEIKSRPLNPPSMKDPWLSCVVVPQPGAPIQDFLEKGESKVDPNDVERLKDLVDRYRTRYLQHLGHIFERLVGTLKFSTGTHHPVAFYQVSNVCVNASSILLIADARIIGGSPGGVVAGNN